MLGNNIKITADVVWNVGGNEGDDVSVRRGKTKYSAVKLAEHRTLVDLVLLLTFTKQVSSIQEFTIDVKNYNGSVSKM